MNYGIPSTRRTEWVTVSNSTPEPDGSTKPYTLRVPPDMTKVAEAVASTFGKQAKEYAPEVET